MLPKTFNVQRSVINANPRKLNAEWTIEGWHMYPQVVSDIWLTKYKNGVKLELRSKDSRDFAREHFNQRFTVINLPHDDPFVTLAMLKFKVRQI